MLEEIEFPAPLQKLFIPKRYKVFWGGRGAGRSWGIARALLLEGAGLISPQFRAAIMAANGFSDYEIEQILAKLEAEAEYERQHNLGRVRALCARELQKSIDESVHQVLSDQIKHLNLDGDYIIQRDEIIGVNRATGSSFVFVGLKNNVSKVKSYEGRNRVWVEEAIKVSRNSWGVLIPTIRAHGSEIWMSFNPELKEDYTYVRFVLNADNSDTIVVKMTYVDNPYFPDVLKKDMEYDKINDYDHYLNIWEGHCLEQLEGAVYAKELRRAANEKRICKVPYEKSVPVDVFFDLGRRHQTACWFVQRVAMQYRILGYFADDMEDIIHYVRELKNREYVYGTIWLPQDARAKRLGMKTTMEEQFRTHFPQQVGIVPSLSIEDGINAARMILHNCYFDEVECADGLDALRHYRYLPTGVVDFQGRPVFSDKPDQKHWSADGADAFRYFAVKAPTGRPQHDRQGVKERLMAVISGRERRRERHEERPDSYPHNIGWMR